MLPSEEERHPLRRLATLARATGFPHYAASPDARFGRQALALLAVTGTPVTGPVIPEAVVVQLQRLAQLSTIARSTVGPLLTGPLPPADASTERAALLAALSWTVLALDLREELLASPSGPRLYAALTGPWQRAIGPLHPDDPDAAAGADDIDAVMTAADARLLREVLAPAVALHFGSPDALRCVSTGADESGDGHRNGDTEFVIAGHRAEHALGRMTYCVVPATEPALRWPALARTGPALIAVRPVESRSSG